MNDSGFWALYGEAAKTAIGFFWKAGWAFVLGYFVSGIIQAFVPKSNLTKYMGKANAKSISIATVFGIVSSSCSFAALAAARALVIKGANFVAAVAFMFASTNLVIELGILIFIFLGWEYLAAEIIGGFILIALSSVLIKMFYPKQWFETARKKIEENINKDEDFDWKQRICSREGWRIVGHKFVMDWKMVWQEILIGFTIAGFVAVFVPDAFWSAIFLQGYEGTLPGWFIVLENALIAPFVAAFTFIGSMGNIPLATVLSTNGVLFAGIIGFIYSDLMVPPLVRVNAKYYGWRVALFIAGVMFISIVITALSMHSIFSVFNILPETTREIKNITQFKVDYTFWMNLFFMVLTVMLIYLHRKHHKSMQDGQQADQDHKGHNQHQPKEHKRHSHVGMDHSSLSPKSVVVYIFIAILIGGMISYVITGGVQ